MSTEIETTRAAWDAIAIGYDRYVTPTHMWLANQALEFAGLERDQRFLDVACGSGALSIPAAKRGAEVTSTDLSGVMVDLVVSRARKEGHTKLEGRVMDGHHLDLPDDSFDLCGSQFGVMLFPDLPRALEEQVRVAKKGGKVLLTVYGPPEEVEFLGFFIQAMKTVIPSFEGIPSNPPPFEFQVADPTKLRHAMTKAGLTNVRILTLTETLEFANAKQMWDWLTNSNPIGAMLVRDLDETQRAEVQHVLDGMLQERAGGKAKAALTNPIHIAVGTK